MKEKTNSTVEMKQEADELRSRYNTLQLSTISGEGFPEISYAPYIEDERKFYIFISGLATHTRNLQERGMAGVMFIEDESHADHAFGRKRLTYRCKATTIPRGTDRFEHLLNRFQNQFGTLIQTLRALPDFQLFELAPDTGRYVAGFGKTFTVQYPDEQYCQITESDLEKG